MLTIEMLSQLQEISLSSKLVSSDVNNEKSHACHRDTKSASREILFW
jgi:hypothetical protein